MKSYPEMKAPAGYIYRREKRDFGEYYDREELITCEDCKWYELPSHKITENCVRWMKSNGILLPINPNDYCSYAERRIDG